MNYQITISIKKVSFMKFKFFFLCLLITFFSNPILSQSKNELNTQKLEEDFKTSTIDGAFENFKIHVVKEGETLSGIAKLYSINKKLIIQDNKLNNENYIFAGQNLKIKNGLSKINDHNENFKIYHNIEDGETLTEISARYGLKLNELIEINNIENPNIIKSGNKLRVKIKNDIENDTFIKDEENKEDIETINKKDQYGPLLIKSKNINLKRRKIILKAIHNNGKEFILSIKCKNREINVRGIGRKWKGWMPAQTIFEKKLLNDFC